jgi:hypothetical protein
MARLKHQDGAIEALLVEAETHGWTFTFENMKFKGRCGCGNHQHVVSQGKQQWRTAKNMRSQIMVCWR